MESLHARQLLQPSVRPRFHWTRSDNRCADWRCSYYKRCDGVYRNHSGMRLDYGAHSQRTPAQPTSPLQRRYQQRPPGPRQSPQSPSRLGPPRTRLARQAPVATPANAPPEQNMPQDSPPQRSRLQSQRSLPRPIPMRQNPAPNVRTPGIDLVTPSTGSATSEISTIISSATSS